MTPQFRKNKDEYDAKIHQTGMFREEDCPFCKNTENELAGSTEHWNIFYNLYPYSGDHRHLMALPKIHKKTALELSPEEFTDLANVHRFMKEYFSEENYFSFTRETMGFRSIEHFHVHFLVGKLHGSFLRKMLELQGYPITQDLSKHLSGGNTE